MFITVVFNLYSTGTQLVNYFILGVHNPFYISVSLVNITVHNPNKGSIEIYFPCHWTPLISMHLFTSSQ